MGVINGLDRTVSRTGSQLPASGDTDTNENDKPLWVTLAQSWLQLAEDADRISSDVRDAELSARSKPH